MSLSLNANAQENETIEGAQVASADLAEMSIESLLNIEITSVSRKSERISDAAAAVYVVTNEDIRRSGATNIPELLRMVPGLHVAQIDANKWVITPRGFSDRFVTKMLVLIDGRSVYTPLFSGVWWDVQDYALEDIDRIEVIRGPGATMWGANAVNGIINIITKNAKNTQGGYLSEHIGTEERGVGTFRYGGKFGENNYYRVYGKYANYDNSSLATGADAVDGWDQVRGGFRIDWNPASPSSFTLQGDVYSGNGSQLLLTNLLYEPYNELVRDSTDVSGGNLLARWERVFSDTSDLALQVYYDKTERRDWQHSDTRDTFDIDFQHRFALGVKQDITWGLGFRTSSDNLGPSPNLSWTPAKRKDDLYSAFIQDEITLLKNRSRLTIGSKFERNDYTGYEVQPNIRFLYTPRREETLWAAISRAVRTPNRSETHGRFFWWSQAGEGGLAETYQVFGSDIVSEDMMAYEIGYRIQPSRKSSFDLTAFWNDYNNLRTYELGTPYLEMSPVPHIIVPFTLGNELKGSTYGAEVVANWDVSDIWRLSAAYSYLQVDLKRKDGNPEALREGYEYESPSNQLSIRSYLDLPRNFEFDTHLYWVDSVGRGAEKVDSYLRCDLRLGWKPREDFDISVGVKNLLEKSHQEFPMTLQEVPSWTERSYYGRVSWWF